MANTFKKAFSGFGYELLDRLRDSASQRISDAEFEERISGIEKATMAMIEAGVDEKVIVALLQKYWDLRLSEAKSFVDEFRNITTE